MIRSIETAAASSGESAIPATRSSGSGSRAIAAAEVMGAGAAGDGMEVLVLPWAA